MRLAWFSPLPPAHSGIAAYSAELLPLLQQDHTVHAFVDDGATGRGSALTVFDAHDFVWRQRRTPYDLVVYQLGNARSHDYMWAYLARYPGLVVLHDARLHHARARLLLQSGRVDDYREEFRFDHPEAPQDVAEYAVEGLGGTLYYFWSMVRAVVATARTVAVHNPRVAADLGREFPDRAIETVHMGVPDVTSAGDSRTSTRRKLNIPDDALLFAAFGRVTREKRIGPILRAVAALKSEHIPAFLMIVGDGDDYPLGAELASLKIEDRVRIAGHVPDDAIGAYLSAADVCLCLRWPTALETSASWLRCLAASRATVISDLAHLVDIPADVVVRIDLLDEDRALLQAMRELGADAPKRKTLAAAGHAYWSNHHTLEHMAGDYRGLLRRAHERTAPQAVDLPTHFTADYTAHARAVAREFRVNLDLI
jgi:glycosyltransferase involved in cell wall biosynthesis